MALIERIVIGGETGADRAALDFAVAHGIPHSGWCPVGRKAEDGAITPCYQLPEALTSDYSQRAEWNVRDSDGTVVFSIDRELSGGSRKTVDFARQHHKPLLHLWRDGGLAEPAETLQRFVRDNEIKALNVAGPRASKEPEVAAFVKDVLEQAFAGRSPVPVGAQPTLETARLVMRPFTPADASTVASLAGRREIADTTISIPHPYSEQQAREWIMHNVASWRQGREAVFVVVAKSEMQLVGAVGLRDIDREHSHAEMGFWIGVPWWGHGYATEAAGTLLHFGFQALRLNRIYAHHMLRNPASGRVLQKIGMKLEGTLRERVRKWGVFEDVAILAILRKEWPD